MATDEEKRRKEQDAAKASAAPSAAAQAAKMSVANEAARLAAKKPVQEKAWVHQPLGKALPKAFDTAMAGIKKIGGGALAPYQTPMSRVDGYTAVGPGRISEGTRTGVYTLSDNGNIPGPSVENKPGYRDRVAPRGITADPTNQQTPASIAAQKAAQPGQNSQSPTGNRYLDMAQYGNNPLMNPSLIDAMTRPATEEAKQRFREMGGIQTIRGTMDPDKRISAGWWNPNTLREHATIQEGMMGVDYPVAAQRYEIDAPIQGDVDEAAIKAKADIARERIGLEKPVPVKMVDPMGNESEVLAYPDRTKIGSGEAGGPDPAKVVEDMAAANSREEAQAILEGQPPAVQEQVRKLWGIVRSLGERQ